MFSFKTKLTTVLIATNLVSSAGVFLTILAFAGGVCVCVCEFESSYFIVEIVAEYLWLMLKGFFSNPFRCSFAFDFFQCFHARSLARSLSPLIISKCINKQNLSVINQRISVIIIAKKTKNNIIDLYCRTPVCFCYLSSYLLRSVSF